MSASPHADAGWPESVATPASGGSGALPLTTPAGSFTPCTPNNRYINDILYILMKNLNLCIRGARGARWDGNASTLAFLPPHLIFYG